MELLEKTKKLCEEQGIKPARSKGQNFLINESMYERIIEVAEIKETETVLEVGPGLGFLTEKLAKQSKQVTAIELDDNLARVLRTRLKALKIENVGIVNEDVLDVLSPGASELELPESKFKIVANLPYNITSIFLRKVYELKHRPKTMVLMLQKEVAERIASLPGKMSKLSVMCQSYARAEIVAIVPKGDFWPSPAVDSAIIKLTSLKKSAFSSEDEKTDFFRLIRIAFAQKRKMLKNNLANGYHVSTKEAQIWLEKVGFTASVRAQELSVNDWIALLRVIEIK